MTTDRLPSAERRDAIIEASLHLFAQHGLHGVTTRQIAEAAGVSEALLYRHFRSKEELFTELQRSCLSSTRRVADQVAKLEPSTSTLVLAIYFMVASILRCGPGTERTQSIRRMMLGSLRDDGAFARGFLRENLTRFMPKLDECVHAAGRAGDLVDRVRKSSARLYFTHHLAAMIGMMQLPKPHVIDYGIDGEALVAEAVQFVLRGIGVKQDAIERHFNPRALSLLVQAFAET